MRSACRNGQGMQGNVGNAGGTLPGRADNAGNAISQFGIFCAGQDRSNLIHFGCIFVTYVKRGYVRKLDPNEDSLMVSCFANVDILG